MTPPKELNICRCGKQEWRPECECRTCGASLYGGWVGEPR